MFKSISEELVQWLSGLTEFTSVMQRNVDGNDKLFLFPIVARIENPLPLTTYVMSERVPETKDKAQVIVTLRFWFGVESYDACCDFTDVMSDIIDDAYMFESSMIDYNEESETFFGEVNFNLV
jgi:hypothetical protein